MQQAGYHHANHLAQQLRDNIEKWDNDILSVIQSAMDTSLQAPSMTPSNISLVTPPHQQHANTIQGDSIQLEMLKILKQMQESMTINPGAQTQGHGGR